MNVNLISLEKTAQSTLQKGSKSFFFASRFFGAEIQTGVVLLYVWCRYCDDLIDQAPNRETAENNLQFLFTKVHEVYGDEYTLGNSPDQSQDEVAAISYVVHRYQIPKHYLLELLEGMAMDVRGDAYPTFDSLLVYAYRVAGVVGLMMSHIMGVSDQKALIYAAKLGNAMQLSNIARDVLEDLDLGRVYLPLEWLNEAKIPLDQLGALEFRIPLLGVVRRLLGEADRLYGSGEKGTKFLSFRAAFAIQAARNIYSSIGVEILKAGKLAWNQRAFVPFWKKVLLAFRALIKVGSSLPKRWIYGWKPVTISLVIGKEFSHGINE
jgi:phytoene synthase